MATRRSSSIVKILHSGHTFSSNPSFGRQKLPTKTNVIERALHHKEYWTDEVARIIAQELVDVWIWCNVYPLHPHANMQ
ncbi:hypothetical protein A3Q56_03194 [Intoshia linei]|uniref:Uncharacterized protein n=1 Tax=Intoshia linei TaxID=1819745 RepID=A0A177B445_9BILA|nr:hypothetical protein A3Q56_03194 [Intoshia linei]